MFNQLWHVSCQLARHSGSSESMKAAFYLREDESLEDDISAANFLVAFLSHGLRPFAFCSSTMMQLLRVFIVLDSFRFGCCSLQVNRTLFVDELVGAVCLPTRLFHYKMCVLGVPEQASAVIVCLAW